MGNGALYMAKRTAAAAAALAADAAAVAASQAAAQAAALAAAQAAALKLETSSGVRFLSRPINAMTCSPWGPNSSVVGVRVGVIG